MDLIVLTKNAKNVGVGPLGHTKYVAGPDQAEAETPARILVAVSNVRIVVVPILYRIRATLTLGFRNQKIPKLKLRRAQQSSYSVF